MEFADENILRKISSYSDLRSIRRWVNSLGLNLIKVGKTWCVLKEELDQALANKYNVKKEVKQREKYNPTGKHEKAFYMELTEMIKEL